MFQFQSGLNANDDRIIVNNVINTVGGSEEPDGDYRLHGDLLPKAVDGSNIGNADEPMNEIFVNSLRSNNDLVVHTNVVSDGNQRNLGSSSTRWENLYVNNMSVSGEFLPNSLGNAGDPVNELFVNSLKSNNDIVVNTNILSDGESGRNLGSPSTRWSNFYVHNMSVNSNFWANNLGTSSERIQKVLLDKGLYWKTPSYEYQSHSGTTLHTFDFFAQQVYDAENNSIVFQSGFDTITPKVTLNMLTGTILPNFLGNADSPIGDIGSSAKRWRDLYCSRSIDIFSPGDDFGVTLSADGDGYCRLSRDINGTKHAILTWTKQSTGALSCLVDFEPSQDGEYNLGSASNFWRRVYANTVYSGNALRLSGVTSYLYKDLTFTGNAVPDNFSDGGARFRWNTATKNFSFNTFSSVGDTLPVWYHDTGNDEFVFQTDLLNDGNQRNLGSPSNPWENVYANLFYVNNYHADNLKAGSITLHNPHASPDVNLSITGASDPNDFSGGGARFQWNELAKRFYLKAFRPDTEMEYDVFYHEPINNQMIFETDLLNDGTSRDIGSTLVPWANVYADNSRCGSVSLYTPNGGTYINLTFADSATPNDVTNGGARFQWNTLNKRFSLSTYSPTDGSVVGVFHHEPENDQLVFKTNMLSEDDSQSIGTLAKPWNHLYAKTLYSQGMIRVHGQLSPEIIMTTEANPNDFAEGGGKLWYDGVWQAFKFSCFEPVTGNYTEGFSLDATGNGGFEFAQGIVAKNLENIGSARKRWGTVFPQTINFGNVEEFDVNNTGNPEGTYPGGVVNPEGLIRWSTGNKRMNFSGMVDNGSNSLVEKRYFYLNMENYYKYINIDVDIVPVTSEATDIGKTAQQFDNVFCKNLTESSDQRLKSEIADIDKEKSKAFVANLRPRNYKQNNGGGFRVHSGFVAQEVRQGLEDAGYNPSQQALWCQQQKDDEGDQIEDGTQALRYTQIIPHLVTVIQDLTERVASLEQQLANQSV